MRADDFFAAEEMGRITGSRALESLYGANVRELTIEEAIVLMEEGGQPFIVFNNKESGQINLVYKRPDGNYGLLERL